MTRRKDDATVTVFTLFVVVVEVVWLAVIAVLVWRLLQGAAPELPR